MLSFTPRVTAGARAEALLPRVLTASLLAGRAAAGVAELACRTRADVPLVREVTGEAAAGLQRAGPGDLLPHQVTQPAPHGHQDQAPPPPHDRRGQPPAGVP